MPKDRLDSMWKASIRKFLLISFLSLAACQPQEIAVEPTILPASKNPNLSTNTPAPSKTAILVTETPADNWRSCFPLQGLAYSDLTSTEININPFAIPEVSLDDGHHGLDIAFWKFGELATMEGLPIQSIFTGKVAAVVSDRIPYGNMIIIETPLTELPEVLMSSIPMPTPAPLAVNDGRLTCPAFSGNEFASAERSLYVLYAHMLNPPNLIIGDKIDACQVIGAVGNTGESSQYHLHLEVRIGPSGASFSSLSHRNTAATEEEMRNYCIWRISDIFQMFNPMSILSQIP